MRLIDADALKNKLQQHHDFFVNAWGGFREMPIQDKARCDELSNSIAEIFNAPSIDIVRCKECRHWIGETEYYEDREYKACWQLCGQYMNSDFWCKYGERKESE